MPRNADTRRRSQAVFLCLQFGLIALGLVALSLTYLAWPVKPVHAQGVMTCETGELASRYVKVADGNGLNVLHLTATQADAYIAEAIGSRPQGSQGLAAILVFDDTQLAALHMVSDDQLCSPLLRVTPVTHDRAITAVFGRAI